MSSEHENRVGLRDIGVNCVYSFVVALAVLYIMTPSGT